ncbi:MAG TPA: NUDIX domain-containing protein [Fimbriimonas sp.]|nr:NUDIX domain-containing protein [Fimbriimonas sp.]
MGSKVSAGILLFKRTQEGLKVLLAHPGGPIFQNKDEGAWTIPKGELDPGEDHEAAARRECMEEIGFMPEGPLIELGSVVQKSGKQVFAWASESDFDLANFCSNTFMLEWPPKSGKYRVIPEVDRCEWMDLETAARKMNPAQAQFLNRLPAVAGE